jgi:hypothetical protein
MEGPGIPGVNLQKNEQPVRLSNPEASDCPSTGGTPKSQGSLPFAVILEIVAQEYSGGAHEEALCRVALRLAEESGLIETYRNRWDEEESFPAGSRSSLLFDRSQSLELINYYKSKGNLDKQRQEKEKLALIEGRLLLGGGNPTRITNDDLEKLEEFIKQSGF